jgi:ribosomal-protein-alanine N-acetyltransferase
MSAQPGQIPPIIRTMRPADLDAITEIENRSYEFPWGRGIFSDCLIAGYVCVVLEDDAGLIGYAIISVAAAEGHILNLCVDGSMRTQGLGRQLLDYLLDQCRQMDVDRLFLEVRPSNDIAVALYDSAGFSRLGLRKDYYKATADREDALVFAYEF